jgi:hypothetical protein
MGLGEGGGEELRLQSREGQELSAAAAQCRLTLKMSSEDQTVDPRNKIMGNDHDTIFVRFRTDRRHKLWKKFSKCQRFSTEIRQDMCTGVRKTLTSIITR